VQTVYLTAGDAGMGASYWQAREAGSEAAYLQMLANAGLDTTTDTHTQQTLTVTDSTGVTHHIVAVSPTSDPRLTQIYLRLPDGLPAGVGTAMYNFGSLTHLWVAYNDATANNPPGTAATQNPVTTVDGANSYTAAGLVSTLTQLMVDYQPTVIKIQDNRLLPYHDASGNLTGNSYGEFCAGPAGPPDTAGPIVSLADCSGAGDIFDHADHIAAAHFGQYASAQYTTSHILISWEDYPLSVRPQGYDLVSSADFTTLADQKFGAFLTYLPHDALMESEFSTCNSGGSCVVPDQIASWILREHLVAVASVP
jgi:hypothetical protein